MPLKLVDPRPGKTPYYYIRGTYLRQYVDESTGTPNKAVAQKFLTQRREAIERGEYESRKNLKREPTFLDGVLSYLNNGGERRFIGEFDEKTGEWKPGLLTHFQEKKLREIDQKSVDEAAVTLYPDATPATRNRQVYTPVSAILKHNGIDLALKRPKGAQGRQKVDWLSPEQAKRMFRAADKLDAEFGIFLRFLCYTGCRLGDALGLACSRLHLTDAFVYIERTKNDEPRAVHLPKHLVVSIANHPAGTDRGDAKLFRFRKNGRLYNLLKKVKSAAGPDVEFASFHTFCHTWATWMRRYAAADLRGLVGTERWKDQKSVARYAHVVTSEESRRADLLPEPDEQKGNKVHGFSATGGAKLRVRSPKNAG